MRHTKPHQWYSTLKYLSNFDQLKTEEPSVESIKHLPDEQQTALIVEKFAKVGNIFDALRSCDIQMSELSENDFPQVSQSKVRSALKRLKTNKATVKGDIPARVTKFLADELTEPLTVIINTAIKNGEWPDVWKLATITPVPKEYPTKDVDKLRGISGLFTESKIAEHIIAEFMIDDMKANLDTSQYANQKGVSAQHYLVKMVDKILKETDKISRGDTIAVLLTMVDWKEAFNRQCSKLGVESFQKCGVRPSLIPLLTNYFQNRKIRVKWHGHLSDIKTQNGGGPQGSFFGILEYLTQTNFNTEYLTDEEKFKFVDDFSILEIVNLLTIGLCSYNMKAHVASDIKTNATYIPPENLKSQAYLTSISEWTNQQKMQINESKTKQMIINFTNNFQFSTRNTVNDKNVEVIETTKLLGTILTNDLKWEENTSKLVKKANARKQLLRKVATFTRDEEELKNIYVLFIRSILD